MKWLCPLLPLTIRDAATVSKIKQRGILIQKMDCQPREMVSQAPRLGPNIMPMGKKPATSPTALALELGNSSATMPVAQGTRPLPPNPWITRKMIKSRALGAKLHRSDPMAKIETKTRKVALRPRASLILRKSAMR